MSLVGPRLIRNTCNSLGGRDHTNILNCFFFLLRSSRAGDLQKGRWCRSATLRKRLSQFHTKSICFSPLLITALPPQPGDKHQRLWPPQSRDTFSANSERDHEELTDNWLVRTQWCTHPREKYQWQTVAGPAMRLYFHIWIFFFF